MLQTSESWRPKSDTSLNCVMHSVDIKICIHAAKPPSAHQKRPLAQTSTSTFPSREALTLYEPDTHQNIYHTQNLEQKLEDLWRRRSLLPTELTLPHNEPFAFCRCLPTMRRATYRIIEIAQLLGYRLITRHNIWVSAQKAEKCKNA